MVCQCWIGQSLCSYRYIADYFFSLHRWHIAYERMLVPVCGTTTIDWCSHLHKTLDLGPIPSYLLRSNIWYGCLGCQWYSNYMGHLVILCDSVRMLPNLSSVDHFRWRASSLLWPRFDVLRFGDYKHDHRHRYSHNPITDGLEATNAHTKEDSCQWYLLVGYIVSLSIPVQLSEVWRIWVRSGSHICSVCGISIARFVFLVQMDQGLGNPYDVTCKSIVRWDGLLFNLYSADNHAPAIYWTQLEGAFAVISACLPTFRPLFKSHTSGSILSIFRNGNFSRLDRSQKSAGASFVPQNPLDNKSDSSLSSFDKHANNAILGSGVAEVRMGSVRDGGGDGILVQKEFGFRCETV